MFSNADSSAAMSDRRLSLALLLDDVTPHYNFEGQHRIEPQRAPLSLISRKSEILADMEGHITQL